MKMGGMFYPGLQFLKFESSYMGIPLPWISIFEIQVT